MTTITITDRPGGAVLHRAAPRCTSRNASCAAPCAQQVSLLLNVLPTASELSRVRSYIGEEESLGRVERFFLKVGAVERLVPRLTALQTTLQFAEQALSVCRAV